MAQMIDHSALSRLVEAGAVKNAHIVANSGGWAVWVQCGSSKQTLTAQRTRQTRLFRNLETLVSYLKDLGLAHFDVDATGFEAGAPKAKRRPDRAQALKRTHEAAAYDTWFREQVQASINDPRASVPNEEARALFAAKRAALQQST